MEEFRSDVVGSGGGGLRKNFEDADPVSGEFVIVNVDSSCLKRSRDTPGSFMWSDISLKLCASCSNVGAGGSRGEVNRDDAPSFFLGDTKGERWGGCGDGFSSAACDGSLEREEE